MLRITDENRAWWTLAGACMGLFILMLDSTVVTLALPSIQHDLDASDSALQWVVNGYLLTAAVLVVTAGRLGDMFGRRRIFLTAMVVFAVGLVMAALAPSMAVLVPARFVQGAGAAGMLTLSLALVSSAFSDADRARALGIWAGVSALALALGPLVGGVLVEQLSWRWVFWIGVPPLALGLLWTARAAAETRDEQAGHRVDGPGVLTLSAGLGALVLLLVEGQSWGWTSERSVIALLVGVGALIAFVVIDEHVRQPIVEFNLFRNRPYLGATAAAFCLVGAWWSIIFFLPQYLQEIRGYGPVMSGVLILPMTVPMIVISPQAQRLIAWVGPRVLMTTGMVLGAIGVAVMTLLGRSGSYAVLLPGLLLFGIALGLVYTPMSTAAMAAMPRSKAGIAAGVLAMNRLLAGAVLLAGTGALFGAFRADRVDALTASTGLRGLAERRELDGLLTDAPGPQRALAALPAPARDAVEAAFRESYAYGLSRALWASVALCAIGAVLTWWLVRAPEPAPADVTPAR